jgi:hypothetical protein
MGRRKQADFFPADERPVKKLKLSRKDERESAERTLRALEAMVRGSVKGGSRELFEHLIRARDKAIQKLEDLG